MECIEDIADEIVDGIHKDKTKIIKCWNFFFPEERIGKEVFSGNKEKDLEVKTELLEIMKEEIVAFENIEKVKKIYEFATDNEFPELIDENISLDDWDEDDQ